MEVDGGVPIDDKAKRMRDLLSSFYSSDPASASSMTSLPIISSRFATLDTINTASFDAGQYMNLLVQKENLEGLLQKHVEMAAEIKNLDTDLQMLVYENYNKFISATDTIKRMKNNIAGMETSMEQLLEKIMSVQSRSDGVNTSLFKKREHIEKLHRTRNLLRKVQFIYDLPARLEKCIKSESYDDAVKFYTGAMPIFQAYGDSSFRDCKRQSEAAVGTIIKNLQGKVFSDAESIQKRAEAFILLKRLDFPVETLKVKLFEKLEQFIVGLSVESKEKVASLSESSDQENASDSAPQPSHEASIQEFVETICAYRVIFPNSESELSKLAKDHVNKHFEAVHEQIKKHIHSEDLVATIRIIWTDVLLIDGALPEASLQNFTLESARIAVKKYIFSALRLLSLDISGTLTKIHVTQKSEIEGMHALQVAFEASKKKMMQGNLDVLRDFRVLVDEISTLSMNLSDSIIDWVLEGFQDFFTKLNLYFRLLSGKTDVGSQEVNFERIPGDKVSAGLVLVLSQLCIFIEQSAVPRIAEEIASIFYGGVILRLQNSPTFVPADTCRTFQASRELLLNLYVKMRNQKISFILKRRFAAPNWAKHKEPREVHMFVDLLLKELEETRTEVRQVLPQSPIRKHRRSESNGSTTSSRSNPLRDDRLSHHTARSQLLETHLAKLFKQKMEIFTKVEHTQESVLTTIVKLSLKSLHEFARLQTFNRSGFQQIQLDIHFLKSTLKDLAEDEAAVDFLLDEVIVASEERCLDVIPLEPPILDRLVQAKLAKSSEQQKQLLHPVS